MLLLAELWSQFSTCVRRQVGAVVYDPKTFAILGMGYNDTPFGAVDCGDGGCMACSNGSVRNSTLCECVHGEMNAILLSRADVRDAHLAVWNVKDGVAVVEPPCVSCHKNRIQAGIAKVLIGDGDRYEYVEP
jgi:dCMP deaminase